MGVDGLYFDATHMPIYGCWCDFCKEKFKKLYGMDPPKKPDPQDVVWARHYVEFNNRTVEETFIEWIHLYPTLLDHHLSSRLMTIADSVKSEFNIPARKKAPKKNDFLFKIPKEYKLNNKVRLALGFTLIRNGTFGRPAHVWIPEVIDETSTTFTASLIVATGNIANINVWENYLKNNKTEIFFSKGHLSGL